MDGHSGIENSSKQQHFKFKYIVWNKQINREEIIMGELR